MNLRLRVKKSQANSMDHLRDLGYLSHAVSLDMCELCGAYQLENMCLKGGCGGSWQAKPGWTKLASQYVGIDAVMGRSEYGNSMSNIPDRPNDRLNGIDLSGIAPSTHRDGLCGSNVTEAPPIDSFFYVLKADFKD